MLILEVIWNPSPVDLMQVRVTSDHCLDNEILYLVLKLSYSILTVLFCQVFYNRLERPLVGSLLLSLGFLLLL